MAAVAQYRVAVAQMEAVAQYQVAAARRGQQRRVGRRRRRRPRALAQPEADDVGDVGGVV